MLSVKVKVKHHYSHFAMDKNEPGNYFTPKIASTSGGPRGYRYSDPLRKKNKS